MSETIEKPEIVEAPPIQVRRAFAPDISEMEPWLLPRLMAIYPGATMIGLRSALMHACVSNEQFVGRTVNAIGAVRSMQEHLSGVPVGKVWFAIAKNGDADAEEIAELHDAFLKWMRPAGMTVLILSPHIDCDRSYIRHRIGTITKHEIFAWHAEAQKDAK